MLEDIAAMEIKQPDIKRLCKLEKSIRLDTS